MRRLAPIAQGRRLAPLLWPARTLLLVVASTLGLAACEGRSASGSGGQAGSKPAASANGFASIDITGADYAKDFELPDAQGQVRRLADFKGKLVLVFFGFTQCPDVCPTTLAELVQVKQALGADGARVQTVFVTVDPERDTAELLKAYAANFGNDVVALRGTPEQTVATAKAFKAFFAKVPGKTPTSYTMDHTAGLYVFDTQGRIRLFTRHGMGMKALTSDLQQLLAAKG